ncbi:MAG: hypothetical protein NC403_09410 [Muribaculaceae bacterium]|nr:hypothetical protein [Muribaculaceae bacterium]MCM1532767.1 hypothetical protein [Ruminococcus flavefaciens]
MATKQPIYGWETQHDTANHTMTHTFTKRVQVVSNYKKGEAVLLVDGKIAETYGKMPVNDYTALLLDVEQYANQLERNDKAKKLACKVVVYAIMVVAMLALFALAGDNDEWSLGMFTAQKVCCFAIMGSCYYGVKYTPALAAAWQEMNNSKKA